MKKKAFTLIELIAVLVILAILALIVTPLVMNIIRKARISADKRSIDAYGRSVELAIASYLLDNGKFPTSIDELSIEYSGDKVVCSTAQLNSDSSVYLAGCQVEGRSVDYIYGNDKTPTYTAYNIGDEVTYNGVDYYVIKDSDTSEESVTLLKAEPLTAEEIATYLVGTGASTDGNGGMQYHSDSSAYSTSYVKVVVDDWGLSNAPAAIEVRLLTYDDLIDNLGYDSTISSAGNPQLNENVPDWLIINHFQWTMTPHSFSGYVWGIFTDGTLGPGGVNMYNGDVVRPVITIKKSALQS